MDNFLPFSSSSSSSSSSSNTNSLQEHSSMDLNNNNNNNHSHFFPPYSYVACPPGSMNHHLYNSSEAFPQMPVNQTGSEFGSMVCNNPGLRRDQRSGFLDPNMTRMARINRKKAMIRSRNYNSSDPNSRSNYEFVDSKKPVNPNNMKNDSEVDTIQDVYRFWSFDNKKLKVLLVKHLKNSDVGSLGRIVLPKREAEGNLPQLIDKEGIMIEMRDINSMYSWSFKYKFWSNNKSRMYVLENTGEFVNKNGVEIGDYFTIYEDESKNLYFSIRKCGKQNESTEVNVMNNIQEDMMFDYYIPKDEEEDSIAMLIGNLNDQYPIPSDFMDLTIEHHHHHHQATYSSTHVDHVTNPRNIGFFQ
ncbi:unnamed protein product [Cochlearia groenlandica]